MKKYQLMVDPTPYGWAYGFPRALPEEAVGGTGYDLWVRNDFDLAEWVCSYGYPEQDFEYVKYYSQEVDDMCGGVYEEELEEKILVGEWPKEVDESAEKMGDMKFTTAKDFMDEQEKYVYPGSDPQE